jgi:hypothetical protein
MLSDVGPDANNLGGPIATGYTKGSDTIVLVNSAVAANLAAGQTVLINQLNDPSFVNNLGYCGIPLTWGAGSGLRVLGESHMIKSVNGLAVTLTEPLWYTYEAEFAPKIIRLNSTAGLCMNAGIENLTIDGNTDGGAGGGYIVRLNYAAHCWVKNCEIKDWNSMAIRVDGATYGCEFRRNYFHDVTQFTGSAGYGVAHTFNPSYNLTIDNAFKWVHVCMSLGSGGASGNAIVYNYGHSSNHWQYTWCTANMSSHGAHTYMNLIEGNQVNRFFHDGYWGTGSHLTLFRNWSSLITNNPAQTNNIIAIEWEVSNYYNSAYGNILGYSGMTPAYYEIGVDGALDHQITEKFCWKLGFTGSDQLGARDPLVLSTAVRHGNYDYYHNAVDDWIAGVGHDIPPSLYVDTKPSFFGSRVWPPFGPDVSGLTNTIPAKGRWDAYQISGNISDMFADEA